MSPSPLPATEVEELLDDAWLDLEGLCRIAGVTPPWVQERIAAGFVAAQLHPPADTLRFDSAALRRVRCMAQLEQNFDAVPELAALVADLQDELVRLRARLRRLGLDEEHLF